MAPHSKSTLALTDEIEAMVNNALANGTPLRIPPIDLYCVHFPPSVR